MSSYIDEPIQVLTLFKKNKIIPLKFMWQKKPFLIETVNFVHESQKGDIRTINFSVATKTDAYQIAFNTKDLTWRLCDIYTPTSGK